MLQFPHYSVNSPIKYDVPILHNHSNNKVQFPSRTKPCFHTVILHNTAYTHTHIAETERQAITSWIHWAVGLLWHRYALYAALLKLTNYWIFWSNKIQTFCRLLTKRIPAFFVTRNVSTCAGKSSDEGKVFARVNNILSSTLPNTDCNDGGKALWTWYDTTCAFTSAKPDHFYQVQCSMSSNSNKLYTFSQPCHSIYAHIRLTQCSSTL